MSDPFKVILFLISVVILSWFIFILSGCAPPPHRRPQVETPTPALQPTPVAVPTEFQQLPPPQPVVQAEQPRKKPDFKDVITKSAATFAFNPDHEYVFACPMWELLTIRLIPGETYQDYGSANLVEWMVQPLQSSVENEPTTVLLIKRGPVAPAATLVIVTDKNTYRMKLTPD